MPTPPSLSTSHAAGQTILSADIDDIAAGINKTYLGITRYNLESWGGLRNTDNATVLTTILAAMSSAPGILYVPGGVWPYSNSGGLVVPKTACGIIGDGWTSILQPTASVTSHALSTHSSSNSTTDPNASGSTLMNFQLDCSNMLGSAGYTPTGATLNGIQLSSLPAYASNTGDQKTQAVGFAISGSGTGSVQTYNVQLVQGLGPGDTVVINGATPAGFNGTYTVLSGTSSSFTVSGSQTGTMTTMGYITNPNGGLGLDGAIFHEIHRVLVKNAPQDAFAASGQGGHTFDGCLAYQAGRYSFSPTFDSELIGCISSQAGYRGFSITTGPLRLLGCKAYYSGKVSSSNGVGFYVNGGSSGGVELIGCEAQDNRAQGYLVTNSANISIIGCVADSNNGTYANTTASYPGIDIFQATNSNFQITCMDRQDGGAGFNRQLQAIQVRSTSINNKFRVTHLATAGAVGVPILSWDANCVGNDVSINGSRGQQNVAYAATITPDPTKGGTIIVGALTGALTIAAVAAGNYWPGQIVTFHLTQDATGGRAITWNAQYHLAGPGTALPTTLSRRNIIEFEWDATAGYYVERNRSVTI